MYTQVPETYSHFLCLVLTHHFTILATLVLSHIVPAFDSSILFTTDLCPVGQRVDVAVWRPTLEPDPSQRVEGAGAGSEGSSRV